VKMTKEEKDNIRKELNQYTKEELIEKIIIEREENQNQLLFLEMKIDEIGTLLKL